MLTEQQKTEIREVVERGLRDFKQRSKHWTWSQFMEDMLVAQMTGDITDIAEKAIRASAKKHG
jgi:uncharacterized protein YbcI